MRPILNYRCLAASFPAITCTSAGLLALWDKAHAIWSTRPTTIIHGDLNTGNMWKTKSDGGIVMADWQLTRMAPPAIDLFTMFLLADVDAVGNGKWRELIEHYHALLAKSNPDVAAVYTVQHIIDDMAMACVCAPGLP